MLNSSQLHASLINLLVTSVKDLCTQVLKYEEKRLENYFKVKCTKRSARWNVGQFIFFDFPLSGVSMLVTCYASFIHCMRKSREGLMWWRFWYGVEIYKMMILSRWRIHMNVTWTKEAVWRIERARILPPWLHLCSSWPSIFFQVYVKQCLCMLNEIWVPQVHFQWVAMTSFCISPTVLCLELIVLSLMLYYCTVCSKVWKKLLHKSCLDLFCNIIPEFSVASHGNMKLDRNFVIYFAENEFYDSFDIIHGFHGEGGGDLS